MMMVMMMMTMMEMMATIMKLISRLPARSCGDTDGHQVSELS
jgi:hypothetical protein